MTIYIDSANIDDIRKYMSWGVIKGCTTNQKIFLQEKGVDYKTRIKEILNEVCGPVSVELTKTDQTDDVLVKEALDLKSLDVDTFGEVVIKVPMWADGRGLKIASQLIDRAIPVNMTCCMSVNQAILACELGADYVSLFFNRMIDFHRLSTNIDEAREQACITIIRLRELIKEQGYETKIIVGSIREVEDVEDTLCNGAHIVTIPPKILEQLPYHPKTEEAIKEFDQCWREFKKR